MILLISVWSFARLQHIREDWPASANFETSYPALVVEGPASRRTRLSVSGVDDDGWEPFDKVDIVYEDHVY